MIQNQKPLHYQEASPDLIEKRLAFGVRELSRRDGGPMRDPLKLHPVSIVSMIPSWKSQRRIYTTMGLERRWATVFEVDPRVASYRSQPFTLFFRIAGTTRQYTPDYELEMAGGLVIVETKPTKMARDPDVSQKLSAVERIFRRTRRGFKRLGEEHLPNETWLEAAEYIASHGRTGIQELDKHWLLKRLKQEGSLSLDEAASLVLRHDSPRDAVLSLIIRPRLLVADMSRPISGSTKIRLLGTPDTFASTSTQQPHTGISA